jgi:hypothetical protein
MVMLTILGCRCTLAAALVDLLLYFPDFCQGQDAGRRFRSYAPLSFHTGSVLHGYGAKTHEPDYRSLNLEQFSASTASLYLAYDDLWTSPDSPINITGWASLVDTLWRNNDMIHGHVLLYPLVNTDSSWWMDQPDNLVEERMYKYIDTLATVRKGKIWTWDVVNEVMGDDGNMMDSDGVRTQFSDGTFVKEYQAMGQDFIKKAFFRAKQADPKALLLFTDYSCESDDPDNDNEKSDRLYRFVQKLQRLSVPIDGIGFQMHVSSIPGQEPNYARIKGPSQCRGIRLGFSRIPTSTGL